MTHVGKSQTTSELTLPLSEVASLFNPPRVDPLSRSPAEVLGVSGVDYLLELLHLDRKNQASAKTLLIVLPPKQLSLASSAEIQRALRRHLELRVERLQLELRNTYRYGWRVTLIAFFLLAVCVAIASLFASAYTEGMRPLIRKTLENGFEIIGWVILWHPVDVLVFSPLPIGARIDALKALAQMNVALRADSAGEVTTAGGTA